MACLVVLMTLVTTARLDAATPATPARALDACVTRAASDAAFNGSVLLSRGDAVVARDFGTADTEGKRPIDAQTRFNIASVGKVFTAVAIGILVERDKIDVDAPIARYLPDIAKPFAAITIRQLLSHTSGLGDYLRPENMQAIAGARTATDLLPMALASPPAFPPGSKTAYSNSGYVVLGAIVETLSGRTYADFVQREIFTPAGMIDTRATDEGAATPLTRLSLQGGMLDRPQPSPMPSVPASPAGGWFSTAADMSRFLGALAEHRLLRKATLEAVLPARPHAPARIGHNGGIPGANAEVWLYPDTGWRLVVLSNYDPPGATRMAAVLEAAMLSGDPTSACTAALAEPAPPMPGAIVRLPPPK